jgi:hypothetical protein
VAESAPVESTAPACPPPPDIHERDFRGLSVAPESGQSGLAESRAAGLCREAEVARALDAHGSRTAGDWDPRSRCETWAALGPTVRLVAEG